MEDELNTLKDSIVGSRAYYVHQTDEVEEVSDAVANEEQELEKYRQLLKQLPWYLRPSIYSITFLSTVWGIASASSLPSKIAIYYKLSCNSIADRYGICDPVQTQVVFSTFMLVSEVLASLVSLFSLGIIGELSDKYGRKPFFMGYTTVLLLGESIRFWAIVNYDHINYWVFIPAIILLNIFGGRSALLSFSSAYVSDIFSAEEKTSNMSLIGASMAAGLLLGTILSRIILMIFKPELNQIKPTLKFTNEFMPLVFEIVLLSVLTVYCIFILPESRNEKAMLTSRKANVGKDSSTGITHHLKNIFTPLSILVLPSDLIAFKHNHRAIRTSFIILVGIGLMSQILGTGSAAVFFQYAMLKFNLQADDISNIMLIVTTASIFALGVFTPVLSTYILPKLFKFKVLRNQVDLIEISVMAVGSIFGVIGNLILLTGFLKINAIIGLVCICFSSIIDAPNTSSLLKFLPDRNTGEFFAAATLLINTFTILTPILTQSVYRFMLLRDSVPHIFLFCASVLSLILVLLYIVKRLLHITTKTTDDTLNHVRNEA